MNDLLTYLGFPVLLGLSATYWRYMHIVRHHPAPNVRGLDMDHDLFPWFSILRDPIEQTGGLRRFYYERLQWLVFPLALAVNGFNMQRAGWVYLVGALKDPRQRRRDHAIDVFALTVHYLAWIVLPAFFFPLSSVILFYLLRIGLMGFALFAVLAPGHYPTAAICLERVDLMEENFILRQAATTLNFRTGFLGRFLCSGLEYQIEHHIFPNLSHVHYPKIAPLLKAFCEENGYPYRTLGWGEALWESFRVFWVPKEVRPELGG